MLYRYAAWVLDREGTFDADKHLDDGRLHTYRLEGCRDLRPSSRDTAFSILRTIRHQSAFRDGVRMTRSRIAAPYTDLEWHRFRHAVDQLTGHPWHRDATMLLDLSGELGLRSEEINAVTGAALHSTPDGVVIHPTGELGRRLLTVGPLAARLAPWIGRPEHLLRPVYAKRGNTVNFVAERVAHHNAGFGGFQARRARHRWITNLIRDPVPTWIVMELADLQSDNHTLTDLAAFLTLTDDDSPTIRFGHQPRIASIGGANRHSQPRDPADRLITKN